MPTWTHLIRACTTSIWGSNATLHITLAYCEVSRLCSITTTCLISVFVFVEKSLPCTFFLPCTYINFQIMGHPTLVFRPAHDKFSDNVPPRTCVYPTTCIWQFRVVVFLYASVLLKIFFYLDTILRCNYFLQIEFNLSRDVFTQNFWCFGIGTKRILS